tara:strand:+ start:8863 stop:9087 length:225 start_codon:yes stop_codon:yes gene_type:complete
MKKNDKKIKKELLDSLEKEWRKFFQANHISVSDELIEEIVSNSCQNLEDDSLDYVEEILELEEEGKDIKKGPPN